MDAERIGRACLEYGGLPLAVMMTAGLAATYLPRYGLNVSFLDPTAHLIPFYIVNVWLVIGVYGYRQKYRPDIVLTPKTEFLIAGVAGLGWLVAQPVFLLAGYALFLKAVWHNDQVSTMIHSSLLPDMPAAEEDEPLEPV